MRYIDNKVKSIVKYIVESGETLHPPIPRRYPEPNKPTLNPTQQSAPSHDLIILTRSPTKFSASQASWAESGTGKAHNGISNPNIRLRSTTTAQRRQSACPNTVNPPGFPRRRINSRWLTSPCGTAALARKDSPFSPREFDDKDVLANGGSFCV